MITENLIKKKVDAYNILPGNYVQLLDLRDSYQDELLLPKQTN